MVGSSKILTVSYGTFSCTLEGFDNPFGTMQGIAEYFRDLAAEDRYFGAEPPQPDAQMLHQIAEREVRRRVEARVDDTGVVLRQMESDAAAPQAQPEDQAAPSTKLAPAAAMPATGNETVAEKLSRIRTVVAKARAERERSYAEDEPVVDADDESLLSAFASAEDAETSAEDEGEVYTTEPQVDDESEPLVTAADALEQEDEVEEPLAEDGPQAAADESLPAAAIETAPAVDEDEAATQEASDAVAADPVQDDAPDASRDELAMPVAAVAVGAAADAAMPVAAGLSVGAEERAEKAPEIAVIDLDETELRFDADAADAAAVDMTEADEPEADAQTEELADADVDTSDQKADPATDADVEQVADASKTEAVATESDTTEDDSDAAILAALAEAEAPVSDVTEEAENVADADEAASAEDDAVAAQDDEDDSVELEMEDEDGNPSLVRLTRAEFEQMLASGEIEEIDDEAEATTAMDESDATEDTIRGILAVTDLPQEERDSFAADLAALEAEMGDADAAEADDADSDTEDSAEPIDAAETENDAAPETAAETHLNDAPDTDVADETEAKDQEDTSLDADNSDVADTEDSAEADDASRTEVAGDADLDRLIDQANTQFDEPEGNRRRSAIQHLKRAVAATKADSGLRDRSAETGASIAKFRDDLRQVVRPRRPQTGDRDTRTGRPTDTLGSGPLVLVSSQRVDQTAEPVRPVKPTRPTAVETETDTNAAASAQSFSDFADKRGARELPELLEAAAAYAMIVEGQDSVSRPQLLRRAASVAGEENMTREEGLKSFGQLLRAGRLRKLSAGRFALADDAEPRDSAAG